MRPKLLRPMFLLIIASIIVVGCTATPTPSAPTSAPAAPTSAPTTQSAATTVPPTPAPAARIKELKVGQPANPVDITCWDWTAVNELDIAQHIVEPLWRFDRDGKLQGVVLDSWEMKSPTDWTIKIRKGLKFQDPKYGELKAEDVVASLTWCFKPDGRALPKQSGVIAKMKLDVVDDYTVHVTLPEPGNAGLPNDWIYTEISSKKYLDEVGKGFNLKPMGTGPFKFVEWVPNVRIVADRNPDYWGPAPNIDRITWRILPDPFTRKSEFLTGGLDILPMMDASWLADVKANSNLRVEPVLSARFMMVILPAKQPPFNDKRVRQALNYAINKDEIVKQLFLGVGAVLPTGVVNPVLPEGRPNNVVYPYDANKAKQLLDQARADGVKIGKINLYATNDRYTLDKELGEAVSGYWRAIGLDVTYTPQSNTVLLPKSQALQMIDPHLVGFGNTKLRADYPFTIWLQTRDNPRSRGSEYAVAPKEWDAMIDQLVSMSSGSPESTKLARQLDDMFMDYAPWAFVTNYIDLYGVSNQIDWKPYFYEARYFFDAKPKK